MKERIEKRVRETYQKVMENRASDGQIEKKKQREGERQTNRQTKTDRQKERPADRKSKKITRESCSIA